MKINKFLNFFFLPILFFILFSSCSEFLLVPITVDYPFDENNASSPSKYEIDINDGLGLLDGVLTKDVSAKIIENNLKNQYPEADIVVTVTSSTVSTDDMINIISGKTVEKAFSYTAKITPPEQAEINKTGNENINVSICNFYDGTQTADPVFSAEKIKLTIKNVVKFCTSSEKETILKNCENPDLTVDQLKESCTYLEARHENTSISILLAEVKELQDYRKYLDKIYSATLNELAFTIYEKPEFKSGTLSRFILEAELFAQSIERFKADGTKCEDAAEAGCTLTGINEKGEIENYFNDGKDADDKSIREKYLVGVFGSSDFQIGDQMNLLYTYNGKDILQTAIKHLDFQIGAKSFYLFFPQSGKPAGKLVADIKAKLFFNVEPLN